MKGLDEVASVVKRVFATQRKQAAADKERFGDWNRTLASLLQNAVIDLYLFAARSNAAKKELLETFTELAKERALQSARDINSTTSEWLQEGRNIASVFSLERVITIATTEAAFALQAGKAIVAKATGKKLRWKVGKKPCKFCRSVNGKIVKPGKAFGINHGLAIYHPPAHPHCYCKVEVVV